MLLLENRRTPLPSISAALYDGIAMDSIRELEGESVTVLLAAVTELGDTGGRDMGNEDIAKVGIAVEVGR